MSEFLYRLLCGFLIGVGCILPGVSGGVMAVSFGLYQPMLEALTGFFRDIRKHGAFLLPLAIGGGAGVLMGAGCLAYVMNRWETLMLFFFLGLILGGLPALVRNAKQSGFSPRCLWALLPGALLLMGLYGLGDRPQAAILSPVAWVAAGGIYALGTVIPGLSASFLLIQLGWYQQLLLAFSRLQLPELLYFAAGFAGATLLCLQAAKRLFERWPAFTSVLVLGFVASSVLPAIPAPGSGIALAVNMAMLALGTAISLAMEHLGGAIATEA